MPGPTAPTPVATPEISFSEIEQRVRQQDLRETLRKLNVPDATTDQVFQRQRQQVIFIASVIRQYIRGTTTFAVRGLCTSPFFSEKINQWGTFNFDFPPNDPKYLPEFVRALNYPHLMVEIGVSIPDIDLTMDVQLQLYHRFIIDYLDVYPDWEMPFHRRTDFYFRHWNVVKTDPDYNEVKIVKTNRLSEYAF